TSNQCVARQASSRSSSWGKSPLFTLPILPRVVEHSSSIRARLAVKWRGPRRPLAPRSPAEVPFVPRSALQETRSPPSSTPQLVLPCHPQVTSDLHQRSEDPELDSRIRLTRPLHQRPGLRGVETR